MELILHSQMADAGDLHRNDAMIRTAVVARPLWG
ncbi:hypothetical protein THITH_17150 [Thioalkalivibrio paradoxus ARh 1]|uniref:Uncharacterized protein n=1 Tax=Thioalkalivibrio paradoxus ARh 1 TaxID=713585 RepID=W0DPE4_9GAMM|nr:hypothetical protein THITH_17150 [Thioalkalivibrio paradoxus ARh 1]